MLRDQLVVGIFKEDTRRRLLADNKLTLQRATELVSIEEQVEEDFFLK